MIELDCRGLSCPEPVIKTKKVLREGPDSLDVLVDQAAAKENVLRLASFMGFDAKVEQGEESWRILIRR